jgi:NAD(P)H-hydrate epimerase
MSGVTFLTQEQAKKIDDDLMGPMGFSVDQLMELAGLSVAAAVQKEFSPCKALVICGPGNNGGDGLVAARHLAHFGFTVELCYPKQPDRPLYKSLLQQCADGLDIPVTKELPDVSQKEAYGVIVDAIFGYSFTGEIRQPFDSIVAALRESPIPVVAVDIPSGWDVEKGDVHNKGVRPSVVVSLTIPKKALEDFSGAHYVGGRFVAPKFAKQYDITLPVYQGADQVVKL